MRTKLLAFVLAASTLGLIGAAVLPVSLSAADDGGGGKATVKASCPSATKCPGECTCSGKKCWGRGAPWCGATVDCECDGGEVSCSHDCRELHVS